MVILIALGDSGLKQDTSVKLQDVVMPERDIDTCLLYTSPSPRDRTRSRMPSSA